MTDNTNATHTLQGLRAVWQQRPERERSLLLWTAVLLGLIALWQWGIGPAWAVWRDAPVRQAQSDAQTRQMLQLQAEASRLQAPVRVNRATAMAQLQASADSLLGAGVSLQLQGEQLQVTLKAATSEGLAQWLSQARDPSQALPQQVQLKRQPIAKDNTVVWQGTLLMRLP